MDRFIGKVLDNRYEIVEVIGVGGMAVVYKAKCHRLNRFVAVKVLRDEYAVDGDFRRRFYDESQAVAMLSHPNIVAVYDVSRTEGIEYIVMELIDGITLKDYMGRRGLLGWNEVVFFSAQIAKALEHAHSRGIIHRDIKPQNIMLLRNGTVKVADFGIARHVSKQETYNMGEAIGSVHYVSPEQAKGSYIDNRTDLYSFGVVLYEMLTGRLPFEGDTPISIALQHINSIALPPSDHVPSIPHALEAITMKAMNPSLSRRYATASEMLADLESYRSDPDFKVVIPKVEPAAGEPALEQTRRLNNTGEVELPRISSRRAPGAASSGRARAREIGDWDEDDARPARRPSAQSDRRRARERDREREASGLPASLLFSILAIGLFFAGAVYFMIKIVNPFGDPDIVKLPVPQLVGLSYEALMADDRYAGWREDFVIIEDGYQYNADYEIGIIYDQYPRPGGRDVNPGSEIRVYVSSGIQKTTMNDYLGQEYERIRAMLIRGGFSEEEVTATEVYHDTLAAGLIISSVPGPGEDMAPGQGIHFVVSKGRESSAVKMPDLMGLTLDEAIVALAERGLLVGEVVPDARSAEPELWGKVVWQQFGKDFEIQEGMKVDIHIAEAGEQTTEPTEPPVTQPPVVGGWVGLTHDPYATNSNRVTLDYQIDLITAEGDITLEVFVNGNLEYRGTHTSAERRVYMRLTGSGSIDSGYTNTVRVVQNGQQTAEQGLEFNRPAT